MILIKLLLPWESQMNKKSTAIEKLTLYDKPEESPGYLLWRVSTQWRTSIENTLKKLDLTHPQFVILATTEWLTKNDEKISQVDIAKAAGLDPNTTSQILRGLEEKNLIKRTRSVNERIKNPALTKTGSVKLAKALPAVEQADNNFFSIIGNKKLNELIIIFQELL